MCVSVQSKVNDVQWTSGRLKEKICLHLDVNKNQLKKQSSLTRETYLAFGVRKREDDYKNAAKKLSESTLGPF